MVYYIKDRIIKYNGINGEVFPFLLDLKRITGRILERMTGLDLSLYPTMNEIFNSSTAMDAIINSSTAMNIIANSSTVMDAIINSSTALDKVVNSSIAMNEIANSSTAMSAIINSTTAIDKVVTSSTAVDIIINSAKALYSMCTIGSRGLERLANNIDGTTTVNWEDDNKWQTIYDTLDNATNLFTKSYFHDNGLGRLVNRRGRLITLIVSCSVKPGCGMRIIPYYSGCYSHGYYDNWSTGKHIMWGGHANECCSNDGGDCVVKHYMFTPIT